MNKEPIKIDKSAAYGPLATFREWTFCLFSAKHAETTWLRIEPDKERIALRIIERIIYSLIGALLATALFAIYQYHFYQDMTIYEYKTEKIYVKPKAQ